MSKQTQLKELLDELTSAATFTTGELALEIARRLEPGVTMRVTRKGVRVTHSKYYDSLSTPEAIDDALWANPWVPA